MTLTNIYPIANLQDLSCEYRVYKVKGITATSPEYEKNRQQLVDYLSVKTKSPCALFEVDSQLFVAQPTGFPELPNLVQLVRGQAILESTEGLRSLDFTRLTGPDSNIALRFLKFALEGPLFEFSMLWRPEAGRPFFNKSPDQEFSQYDSEAHLYRGFTFRPMILPDGKLGIAIDTSFKYLSRKYLPSRIMDDYFHRIKGRKCVYEYGERWYEITILGLDGLNVSEVKLPSGLILYDEIQRVGQRSYQARALPRDGSVLVYYNKSGELRRAPSALCRLTYDTDHPSVRKHHGRTIRDPERRKNEIDFVANKYLTGLKFGGKEIMLGAPLRTNTSILPIPRLEFGNKAILTTNPSSAGTYSDLQQFGQFKRRLVQSPSAGFYSRKKLDRQYLILPKSVADTYGRAFQQDLSDKFGQLYGNSAGIVYSPTEIIYDDTVPHSIAALGREILRAVESNFIFAGYAMVMIPRLSYGVRKEDELANLVMRELRKREVHSSIIHNEVSSGSYRPIDSGSGGDRWIWSNDPKTRSRFNGYLENVVLNKILLLNSCWPFVLADGLHADLTIGIDVKNNTAGFTFVYGDGRTFRFFSSNSEQSERLGKDHLSAKLYDFISEEVGLSARVVQTIVIHRDGKLFPEEIQGINGAMSSLAREGKISKDYDCNLTEIRKTSSFPIRFFGTREEPGSQREVAMNPVIGEYEIFGDNAYLAATGIPYLNRGTTRPLHVTHVAGRMPFVDVLEDVFRLSNLTFTKIDSSSRLPLTLKMTDIRLREVAGRYDKDSLKFIGMESIENE